MEEVKFRTSEVTSFLEDKISSDTATQEELELYEDFRWNQKYKKNHTYKRVLRQMKKIYEYGF